MVLNGGPGFALQRGKIGAIEDARHRDDLMAACAKKMVVMAADQLKAGAPVIEQKLSRNAAGRELLGRAEHRGKVGYEASLGEPCVQLFQGPGMALALPHKAYHRGRYACFSGHG
jgi:hypothetical protein